MTVPPGRAPAPQLPLDRATMERWGIGYDPDRGVLSLAPTVTLGESRAQCPPFRAGRTVVALESRVRPSTIALRIEVTFGPPIRIEASLPAAPGDTPILVDEVPVAGPRVAFEARGEHEVLWTRLE